MQPATPTLRELAINAANAANLNSFSMAYKPDPTQANRLATAMAKTYPQLTRTLNLCDSGLVKQIGIVLPSFKPAVI